MQNSTQNHIVPSFFGSSNTSLSHSVCAGSIIMAQIWVSMCCYNTSLYLGLARYGLRRIFSVPFFESMRCSVYFFLPNFLVYMCSQRSRNTSPLVLIPSVLMVDRSMESFQSCGGGLLSSSVESIISSSQCSKLLVVVNILRTPKISCAPGPVREMSARGDRSTIFIITPFGISLSEAEKLLTCTVNR